MSSIQKFLLSVLPDSWAKSMEAESREWIYTCSCGRNCSVWDMGGIRWKAAGNPRRLMKCPACGQTTWQVVSRKRQTSSDCAALRREAVEPSVSADDYQALRGNL